MIKSSFNSVTLRNFTLITFGNMTSKAGTILYNIVLAWWLIEKTGDAKAFGIITAVSMIPVVILSVFNGVIVDRFNRKTLLILADLSSAIACFGASYLVFNGFVNIVILSLVSFLLGASNSLFSPTIKAILPDIIEKDKLLKANSITTTISQVTKVSTPILAGVLLNNLGITLTMIFIINGLTFLISALSEWFIVYEYKKKGQDNVSGIFNDIKVGFTYIYNEKWLLYLLIAALLVNFFIAGFETVLPLFYKIQYLDTGKFYSYALSTEATFGILAGLVKSFSKKPNTNIKSITFNLLLSGIGIILVQIPNQVFLSLFGVGVFSYFLTLFNINFFTLVQEKTDKEKLGRVFSIIFLTALAIMPLGNLLFGFIGLNILPFVFIICGLGIVLSAAVMIIKPSSNKGQK